MEDTQTGRRRGALRAVLVLAVLALLPRMAVVLAPRPDLYHSNPRAPRNHIGEEIARGNVAQELRQGPLLSLIDYQYAHFFGGSTVTAIAAVPVFAALGPSLFALKLVPIAFHLAALACLFAILDRFVSRRSAWIGGLLFAWTPPGYTLLSTVAWGSHVESNLLALACTWQLLALHDARVERTRAAVHRQRFVLGLSEGFALFFGYQCALFVATLAVLDLVRDRRFLLTRGALWQFLGGVIGFLPWLAYNLRNDFAGLGLYGRGLGTRLTASEGPLERLHGLVTHGLPGSAWFPDAISLPSKALGATLFVVLAALAFAAVRRPRGAGATPARAAGLYLTLFLIAFAASDFPIGHKPADVGSYRYSMLIVPFLILAVASGAERLMNAVPKLARPLTVAVSAVALACAAGIAGSVDREEWGVTLRAPGHDTKSLGAWIAIRFPERLDVYDRVVAGATSNRTREERRELFTGMSRVLRFQARAEGGAFERARAHMQSIVPAADAHLFAPLD
ncbi:MAG: glycosyltransferase family 39 protein [bacterium]|nr:glycosyltransferase family 39 protein [bacterium]